MPSTSGQKVSTCWLPPVVTSLLHRIPQRCGGLPQSLPLPITLAICRVRGGTTHTPLVHGSGIQHLYLPCIHRVHACLTKKFPATSLDAASKQLDSWTVFCTVFLGDAYCHPVTQELEDMFDDTKGVSAWLRMQAQCQPPFLYKLLNRTQSEFNKSFRRALEWRHRVRNPHLDDLQSQPTIGQLSPEIVCMTGSTTNAPTRPSPHTLTSTITIPSPIPNPRVPTMVLLNSAKNYGD